jgi:hypothetical protein
LLVSCITHRKTLKLSLSLSLILGTNFLAPISARIPLGPHCDLIHIILVNLSVCGDSQGQTVVDEITISGDCGDGVTITYRDPLSVGTFTGDVDCTLA